MNVIKQKQFAFRTTIHLQQSLFKKTPESRIEMYTVQNIKFRILRNISCGSLIKKTFERNVKWMFRQRRVLLSFSFTHKVIGCYMFPQHLSLRNEKIELRILSSL